ncbi:MAG: aconitase X catalytic domain-containing protein [Nitrososphaerales archaeon]|nr:aconitase X catalytic domain-containing protein [Nitrososphaerales archaeon]
MYLTNDEERALNGEYGEALEMAYRILSSIGRLTNANHLIKISSAHVSGVSYSTIGDYGKEFLENLSLNAKVSVPTTANPAGLDYQNAYGFNINSNYVSGQIKIIEAYRRLGVIDSFTCTPYEGFYLPPKGSHVSWAESSASIYANSILNLMTNRESALSALASAITGKTPYSELHIDELRKPSLSIQIKMDDFSNCVKFALLGYFAGRITRGPMALQNIKNPNPSEAKAICAAMGTSGASGMFTINEKMDKVERMDFTNDELKTVYDELNDAEKGDAIILGCPHLNVNEINEISEFVGDRRLNKKCLIFCSRKTYEEARRKGYTDRIEKAGAKFVCNTCAVFTPIISNLGVDKISTNSCKAAHYIKRVHKISINLKDVNEIIKESCR